MHYTLPTLPFAPDALAPVISEETMRYHYAKHTQTYIDTLNSLIKDTEYEDMSLEEIICDSVGKLFNNAAQTWNHIFYFLQFTGTPSAPLEGKLKDAIDEQFGGLDELKKQMREAGATLFGSGWVWLAADADGKLFILQGKDAENPLTQGLKPIMTIDVWEHAYYIDYRNARITYLDKIWDIINWPVIAARY